MLQKKECVAMLLAGGQGSRLYNLTEKTAKPAVPFGGKYRIIDFTLSNCVNSGIDTVGVLTQYQPYVLNEYIGSGQPWDLDRTYGGVKILPPYQRATGAAWYTGTANAIYQNLDFIERYDPDYVLILSGDHIYKMDYSEMLRYHIEKGADCTIAVIEVPLDEASRFGIMNTNDDGSIYQFEEKPAKPKSTKASMGIYIFGKEVLKKYLEEDEADEKSSNDFGKNVIPRMLNSGAKMFAYPFSGYWKDVGTVKSLWEANMDLIGAKPALDLHTPKQRILSRNSTRPPHFIGSEAYVANSLITEGCEIYGTVINSVLFGGVKVASGAVVKDSVIFEESEIGEGSVVEYSMLDCRVSVGKDCRVGEPAVSNKGIALLGADLRLPDKTVICGGVMTSELPKEVK
ncbi:MAG: glucose-1-phosphate adenylyltransferase [Clostridia bacterium]|nr:glucose-1-phosphate adenylyltransferase [Clostridia bacterium]